MHLGIREEVIGLVNVFEGKKFLDINESTVEELLLKFLSTFNFHKLNINYDQEDTIKFRLEGIPHSMSIMSLW